MKLPASFTKGWLAASEVAKRAEDVGKGKDKGHKKNPKHGKNQGS